MNEPWHDQLAELEHYRKIVPVMLEALKTARAHILSLAPGNPDYIDVAIRKARGEE